MMGSAQHGQMSVVGYDLYCRMLEETIKLIRVNYRRSNRNYCRIKYRCIYTGYLYLR